MSVSKSARTNIKQAIFNAKVLVIVRLKSQSEVSPLISCVINAGIKALEITSNTPGFCEEIAAARKAHPHILIGAGTILEDSQAKKAIRSGAQFLVTPNINKSIVEVAHDNDIPVLMGAYTPSEIAKAIEWEADIIKLFPAGDLGLGYYKSIQGPFDNTSIVPVGGIDLHNIRSWFDAGAPAVGIGSDIASVIRSKTDESTIANRVKSYLAAIPD
jgi:2-dehydro-3-deoxyphosphogluconate aldolase/(4S)-4-hydroxy-2-oxoglutarate aldolase